MYGNGGPTWVDDHVEAFVNIAGPLLGVAKCVVFLLHPFHRFKVSGLREI